MSPLFPAPPGGLLPPWPAPRHDEIEEPPDDNATLAVGDVAKSLYFRHRGRHYLITEVAQAEDPKTGMPGSRILIGRRFCLATGKPTGERPYVIRFPLLRVGTCEELQPKVKKKKRSAGPQIIPDFARFNVGDLVEDSGRGIEKGMRSRYRISRLGDPTMKGRVLYGRRIGRVMGKEVGYEVEITWAVRGVPQDPAPGGVTGEGGK